MNEYVHQAWLLVSRCIPKIGIAYTPCGNIQTTAIKGLEFCLFTSGMPLSLSKKSGSAVQGLAGQS